MEKSKFVVRPIDKNGAIIGWDWDDQNHTFTNPEIAQITWLNVCEAETERPIFSRPVIAGLPSAYYIIFHGQNIALIYEHREIVLAPDSQDAFWSKGKIPPINQLAAAGKIGSQILVRLPAGIDKYPRREAEQEIGSQITNLVRIGRINGNSGYFATSPYIYLGYIYLGRNSLAKSPERPETSENIIRVAWIPFDKVMASIVQLGHSNNDGGSLAALAYFRTWGLAQVKISHWHRLAEKM